MKAFVIPRNLKLNEFPSSLIETADPVPKENEIIINIQSTALNFFDILQIQGLHQSKPAFPWVAGAEYAGIVDINSPIPAGCPFIPGKTRLFGSAQGTFATKVAVDWRTALEIPGWMEYEEAAGLSVTFPTSYAALVNRAQLKAGETVLVHAGAGGVSLAAIQIAKALGATVIATAGTAEKVQVAKSMGADHGLIYTENGGEDWKKEVLKITKGKGVDVVYDPVGMAVPSLKVIAWNGRIVIVGFAGGTIEKIPANILLVKNVGVMGVHWGAYVKNEPEAIPIVWKALLDLFNQKKIRGTVFKTVYQGLEQVPEGLRALGARETWGKVIVNVYPKGDLKSKL